MGVRSYGYFNVRSSIDHGLGICERLQLTRKLSLLGPLFINDVISVVLAFIKMKKIIYYLSSMDVVKGD
jgi:hypothetical protein